MSSRNVLAAIVLSLCVASVAQIDSRAQSPHRPGAKVRIMSYDPVIPIVERLLPSDDIVVVEKNSFPPGIALNAEETLDAALDHAMLHDSIVVAHGLVTGGTLIDEGTWVRGTVKGSISQIIKAGNGIDRGANRVTFWHHDGEMFIRNVQVKAGIYPLFDPSSSYLLMLGNDESRGPYLARAFKVGRGGALTTLMQSDGQTQLPTSALIGKTLEAVVVGLRKRVK